MDALDRANRIAARQHGVLDIEQARTAGLERRRVQRLVHRGLWRRHRLGVFGPAGAAPGWHTDLAAAWLRLGAEESVVSRRSAARLWRLPGFERTQTLEFVVPRGHTPRLAGVHVARTIHLPDLDVAHHPPFAVTSVTRTLHDLAPVTPTQVLLIAAGEAYRLGRTDPWRLLDSVRARPGLAGNARLRAVIGHLDPRLARTRSVAEIVANVRLRELGYDDFEVNVRMTLNSGRRVEVDVLFPPRGVLEVNGARYHGSVVQRRADRERRDDLEDDGYVVRELWAGELHDAGRVREVVDELLARATRP